MLQPSKRIEYVNSNYCDTSGILLTQSEGTTTAAATTSLSKGKKYRFGPRDSQARRDNPGRRGSRRYRRHENKLFLTQDMDEFGVEDFLFAEPFTSAFALLLSNGTHMMIWERFCALPEEQQYKIIKANV